MEFSKEWELTCCLTPETGYLSNRCSQDDDDLNQPLDLTVPKIVFSQQPLPVETTNDDQTEGESGVLPEDNYKKETPASESECFDEFDAVDDETNDFPRWSLETASKDKDVSSGSSGGGETPTASVSTEPNAWNPSGNTRSHILRFADSFPWLIEFSKHCSVVVGTTDIVVLENLMTEFISLVEPVVKECYTKPNRAAKLKQCISGTLLFFRMHYSDIRKPLEHSSYLNKMSQLMAFFIDMEFKASDPTKESLPTVANKLITSLYLYLDRSTDHILDSILRTNLMTKRFRELSKMILSRILRDSPGRIEEMTYVRYILVFKMWKRVAHGVAERKQVMKMAETKLPPPHAFREKLKEGFLNGVVPNIPKSRANDITTFLMQAKFCPKEKAEAFIKIVSDPERVSCTLLKINSSFKVEADNVSSSDDLFEEESDFLDDYFCDESMKRLVKVEDLLEKVEEVTAYPTAWENCLEVKKEEKDVKEEVIPAPVSPPLSSREPQPLSPPAPPDVPALPLPVEEPTEPVPTTKINKDCPQPNVNESCDDSSRRDLNVFKEEAELSKMAISKATPSSADSPTPMSTSQPLFKCSYCENNFENLLTNYKMWLPFTKSESPQTSIIPETDVNDIPSVSAQVEDLSVQRHEVPTVTVAPPPPLPSHLPVQQEISDPTLVHESTLLRDISVFMKQSDFTKMFIEKTLSRSTEVASPYDAGYNGLLRCMCLQCYNNFNFLLNNYETLLQLKTNIFRGEPDVEETRLNTAPSQEPNELSREDGRLADEGEEVICVTLKKRGAVTTEADQSVTAEPDQPPAKKMEILTSYPSTPMMSIAAICEMAIVNAPAAAYLLRNPGMSQSDSSVRWALPSPQSPPVYQRLSPCPTYPVASLSPSAPLLPPPSTLSPSARMTAAEPPLNGR